MNLDYVSTKTPVEIASSHYVFQNLALHPGNGLSSALPWFWYWSCQPWSSLTVKATREFCAKQISAKIPSQRLIHFVSISIPLLSGYSSWPFISIIDRRGEKKKKPKPQNQNTYCPQEKSSRPHKHCLSHYIIHQYLPAKAEDGEKRWPDKRALGQLPSAPFPQGCLCLCPAAHKDTAARLHLHTVGLSGCLHTLRELLLFLLPWLHGQEAGHRQCMGTGSLLSSPNSGGGPGWYCTHLGMRGIVTHAIPPHQAGRWGAGQ